MNKTELIAAVAKKANMTKVDAAKAINAFIDVTKETVKADKKLSLIGFGSMYQQKRAARKAINPRTGKTVKVPAKKVVKFKVSKAF